MIRSIPRLLSTLVLSSLLLFAGTAFAGGMSKDARALMALDDEWSKSAATRDAAKVGSYYADDAIAYPPNAPMASGRAAAQYVWASMFSDASFTIAWTTVHVEVNGDLGYTSGTYEGSWKGTDGAMVKDTGKYVCVWKKQKGTWKAIHDIWNSDLK